MSEIAIRASGLGKRYRIGQKQRTHHLREAIMEAVCGPFRRFRDAPTQAPDETIWALRDVSFEVRRGEVVGVVGRNGAGKSTLLKILSRITEPTEGEAHIYGRVGSLLEVGTGFHPELTGRENIFLNGAILGMKRREIEQKFDEIVGFSEVEKFIDTPVKRYSSGMYVRLAFAVAAHLEPDILVVDEVLAVGDLAFQKKCLGKMSAVASGGHTVLFVSHNTAAIESLCDRGIVLEGGSIAFAGSKSEAVTWYHRTIAGAELEGRFSPDAEPEHEVTGVFGPRIVDAIIKDVETGQIGQVRAGGSMQVRVECFASDTLDRPGLGIGIDSAGGQRIVTLHTNHDPSLRQPAKILGSFAFVCTIELPLAPGSYTVELNVESADQTVHRVKAAMRFTVLSTDYYGSGKLGRGVVLCRQAWSLDSKQTRSDSATQRDAG